MPITILINNGAGYVDYTRYLVAESLTIEDSINVPTVVDFTLSNIDALFVIPRRNAYVKIYSSKRDCVLASGFITSDAQERFIGGSYRDPTRKFRMFEYDVAVTSDEWLLNVKSLPFQPALLNQTMGSIIRTLTQALVPNFYDVSNVDEGDIVPIFNYDPRQKWSEIVKGFADGIRYRYKVLDRKIYFKPYGDHFLGVYYNDTQPLVTDQPWHFDPFALSTQLLNVQPVNDVTVTGEVEGRNIRDDYFIGNGVEGNFPLRHRLYKGASALLLKEDWTGGSFSTDLWTVVDNGPFFTLDGALNVVGGTGVLGDTVIQGKNGVELAGQLLLEHGEIFFNNTSRGIIGGVWASTPFSSSGNCIYGFDVRPGAGGVVVTASGASGLQITPLINGVLAVSGVTVKANHHYFLQTLLTSKRPSRYNKVYRTLSGVEYGGDELSAPVHATFFTTEINLADPMHPTVFKHEVDTDPPSFGLYLPLNVADMNLVMTSTTLAQPPQVTLDVKSLVGPTGTQLPILPQNIGPERNYIVGFGTMNQTATMGQAGDAEALQFYFPDTIPAVGARIRLQSWEAQHAVARVQDPVCIISEAVVTGDNGIRSATITDLNPLPRTSEECELAAKVIIADRCARQYNGSYTFKDDYLCFTAPGASGQPFDFPRSGRFFVVSASDRGLNESFLIRKVTMVLEEPFSEKVNFNIEFGQDQYLNKLLNRFIPKNADLLTSQDTSQRPDILDIGEVGLYYLPDLINTRATEIAQNSVTVQVSDTFPVSPTGVQVEVRRIDTGWGENNQNRIGVFGTPTFTLPRQLIDQTYYLRFVAGDQKSRRSKVIRVNYPLVPDAPTGFLDIRDFLKPKVNLQLVGDIRNVYGIEIRSCMNSPATGIQVSGAQSANTESALECLDLGVAGEHSVNAKAPSVSGQKLFHRTEFAFDPSLYAPGTLFYFEAVVSNHSFTTARNIYIQKQMKGRSVPVPLVVQTLSVPPQVFNTRIRFTEPFTGWQYESITPLLEGEAPVIPSLEDQYKVIMDREAGYTDVYPFPPAILPSATFQLHSLRLIGQSVAAQRVVAEIPMSSAGDVTASSNDASDYEFQLTGADITYTDIPRGSVWLYNISEWDSIASGKFFATMQVTATGSNVTGTCILKDYDHGIVVAQAHCIPARDGTNPVNVSATFTGSGLQDGHKYTIALSLSGAGTVNFYKARTWLVVNPLRKLNLYWRYSTLTSLSRINRILYSPQRLSGVTGMFLEMCGSCASIAMVDGTVIDGDKTDYPGWFGYQAVNPNDHIPAQNWTVDKNFSPVVTEYNLRKQNGQLTIDFIEDSKREIIQAAWQFELFAAQVPGGAAAQGIADINQLRDNLVGTMDNDEDALIAAETGYVPSSRVTIGFRSKQDVARLGISLTALTQSNRYFGSPVTFTPPAVGCQAIWPGYLTDNFALNLGTVTGSGFPSSFGPWWTPLWDSTGSASFTQNGDNFLRGGGGFTAELVSSCTSMPNMGSQWAQCKVYYHDGPIDNRMQGGPVVLCRTDIFNFREKSYAARADGLETSPGVLNLNIDLVTIEKQTSPSVDGGTTLATYNEITGLAAREIRIEAYIEGANNHFKVYLDEMLIIDFTHDAGAAGMPQSGKLGITSRNLAIISDYAGGEITGASPDLSVTTFQETYIQSLLALSIQAAVPDDDEETQLPITNGQVLLQRTFKAPVDLIYEFDNVPYKVRQLCFRAFFFNLMWEYSPALELSQFLSPPATPLIEVVAITAGVITIRLDRINTRDTDSVEVQMASSSTFGGAIVQLKGGPLQSVYALQVPPELGSLFGQYIRARRKDYLGSSDWSETLFISPDQLNTSTWNASPATGQIVLTPAKPFNFSSTQTTIAVTWNAFSITYPDGFVQTVPAGSANFTGLAQLVTYKFYVYLEGVRLATGVVRVRMSEKGGGQLDDPDILALTTQVGNLNLTGTVVPIQTSGSGTTTGSFGTVIVATEDIVRLNTQFVTATLAAGATETGLVVIAKAFTIIRVSVSSFARVRLYATAAQRAADAARPQTQQPAIGSEHGLITELYLNTTDKLDWIMSPEALGSCQETIVTTSIPYSVTNIDTVPQAITVIITFLPSED